MGRPPRTLRRYRGAAGILDKIDSFSELSSTGIGSSGGVLWRMRELGCETWVESGRTRKRLAGFENVEFHARFSLNRDRRGN
jgi:hypothetical protein